MKYPLKIFISVILVSITCVTWNTRKVLADQYHQKADKYWSQAEELYEQERYLEAAKLYEKSIEAEKTSSTPRLEDLAIELNMAGYCYDEISQYDKALIYYEQALELNRKLMREIEIAANLNNIGAVYHEWGQYDKALDFYKQALAIDRKLDNNAEIAIDLNNIGEVYRALELYDKALSSYNEALTIDQELDTTDISTDFNNIGAVYDEWGQYDKALDYYEQALKIAHDLGEESSIATYLSNIGLVYEAWGQHDKALESFEQALQLDRKLNREVGIAVDFHNIGGVYYTLQSYSEAIIHFRESVELLEKIRKTATGDVRRDYLAKEISTYQFLTSCYLRVGDFSKAFQIIELSRAKLLEERLAGSDEVPLPSLEHIQQTLSEDTAVLIYANTDDENMAQILITKEHLIASERFVNEFVQKLITPDQADAAASEDSRGLEIGSKKAQQDGAMPDKKSSLDFKTLIKQYRNQLLDLSFSRGLNLQEQKVASPQANSSKDIVTPKLNRQLYTFLFGNIQKYLQRKTRLLILPDGLLNFLPFETLVDGQGKYLVETYQIVYAQSLGVLELIGHREYDPNRKPLLAFGGAVYEEQSYQEEMVENEAQLVYLQKQVDLALQRGSSLRKVYTQLGRGDWENLPGTLVEVSAIQDVVEGAEVVTGADVNEAAIKALSADGEFVNYKVLHFATHGAVDPIIPDLSALVLSLFGEIPPTPPLEKGGKNEDGYLRAGEIMNLNLKADFVNLSACETGLGRLYSGEGVVGLTQAFLLAGANGLSVSLWPVADESTAQFMAALYTLIEEEGLSYAEAITEVKRRFIRGDFGDAWKAPYFWAPFVYYGK